MENQFKPFSNPANLESVRSISREIITVVQPDEQTSVEELLGGLVEDYEQGLITVADTGAETDGGFGGVDLVTLVVVPLVVAVLTKFFDELIEFVFEKLKEKLKEKVKADPTAQAKLAKRVDELVEEQYIFISEQVKSKKSKPKQKIIKQTTKIIIKRQLGLL